MVQYFSAVKQLCSKVHDPLADVFEAAHFVNLDLCNNLGVQSSGAENGVVYLVDSEGEVQFFVVGFVKMARFPPLPSRAYHMLVYLN